MSHKAAFPPPISNNKNYSSLEVTGLITGGAPVLSWNDAYNGGADLDLPESFEALGNYIIDYNLTPFNYLTVTTEFIFGDKPMIIEIRHCPQTWMYINMAAATELVISPQIFVPQTAVLSADSYYEQNNQNYDPSNNYTLPANSTSLVFIKPGATSVIKSDNGSTEEQRNFTLLNNPLQTVTSIQLT